MALPLILAGVGAAFNMAKGGMKLGAAGRQARLARSLRSQGDQMMQNAEAELDPYKVSDSLFDNRSIASMIMNSSKAGDAMRADATNMEGNLASQIARSSTSASQAQTGAVLAARMGQEQRNKAALADAENQNMGAAMAMRANSQIAEAEDKAYLYNEREKFARRYMRGLQLNNEGLRGQVEADKIKFSAWGDMLGAAGDVAMTIGNAWGTGSGFDMRGMFAGKKGAAKAPVFGDPNITSSDDSPEYLQSQLGNG